MGQCSLGSFTDGTKRGEVAGTLKDCAASQHLAGWRNGLSSLLKVHEGRNSPRHQNMLRPLNWKAAQQKKTWGPGAHQVEHEPARCPGPQAGYWFPWLY